MGIGFIASGNDAKVKYCVCWNSGNGRINQRRWWFGVFSADSFGSAGGRGGSQRTLRAAKSNGFRSMESGSDILWCLHTLLRTMRRRMDTIALCDRNNLPQCPSGREKSAESNDLEKRDRFRWSACVFKLSRSGMRPNILATAAGGKLSVNFQRCFILVYGLFDSNGQQRHINIWILHVYTT